MEWNEDFPPIWLDPDEANAWASVIAHIAKHLHPEVDDIEAYMILQEYFANGPVERADLCMLAELVKFSSYVSEGATVH